MSWRSGRRDVDDPGAGGAQAVDEVPRWVKDLFLVSYLSWREASEALDLAYRRWTRATTAERGRTFEAYREALERELQAARAHADAARSWRRTERGSEPPRRGEAPQGGRFERLRRTSTDHGSTAHEL
jgi:hypothetical protein